MYAHQRRSYYGGMVQVWQHEYHEKIYVTDVNSMYPYQMTKEMPWEYIDEVEYEPDKGSMLMEEPHFDMYLFEVNWYSLPPTFKGSFVCTKSEETGKNQYFSSFKAIDEYLYIRGVTVRRILHHKGEVSWLRCWRYTPNDIHWLRDYAE